MTPSTRPSGASRTAAATRARQHKRALRLAAELTSVLELLDTPALAALIVLAGEEIVRRKTLDRVTARVDGSCHTGDAVGV